MSRHTIGRRHGLALGLLFCLASPLGAGQDPCALLPTSGTRVVTRPCNPRQECMRRIPFEVQGNARAAVEEGCRQLPLSDTCSQTENTNPREDCLNALPRITISTIEGSQGGNKILANRDETLIIRGSNVGMLGNTVKTFDKQVWRADFTIRAGCRPPDCAAIAVHTGDMGGTWRIQLSAAHGHSDATGSFVTVLAAGPYISTTDRVIATVAPKPDLYFGPVNHHLWGEKVTFRVMNKGKGPNVPTNVWLYLRRVEGNNRKTHLSSESKVIPPLCPAPAGTQGAPCVFFWDGEFHVPIVDFAMELNLAIITGESYPDLDSSNNEHTITIPATKRK